MTEPPYDFARERWEADQDAEPRRRRVNGEYHDEADVPDQADVE